MSVFVGVLLSVFVVYCLCWLVLFVGVVIHCGCWLLVRVLLLVVVWFCCESLFGLCSLLLVVVRWHLSLLCGVVCGCYSLYVLLVGVVVCVGVYVCCCFFGLL